jgi:hypothetical protein
VEDIFHKIPKFLEPSEGDPDKNQSNIGRKAAKIEATTDEEMWTALYNVSTPTSSRTGLMQKLS